MIRSRTVLAALLAVAAMVLFTAEGRAADADVDMRKLPAPTGPHAVGRLSLHLTDRSRAETMTPDATDHRQVLVNVWYPAAPGGRPAAYLSYLGDEPIFARSYRSVGVENLRRAQPHAVEGAPVAEARRRYPVILFSHGLGMVSALYAGLIENLASQGYVVVGVDHPYFSSAMRFPDGRITANQSRRPPDRPGATAAQDRLLTSIREAEGIVQAQDLSFVLDELGRLGRTGWPLAGRLDLKRVGVFGHSRGGFAAPHACRSDPRFRACLNLDGYRLTETVMERGLDQPYMHIEEEPPWEPPPTDAELAEAGQTRAEAEREAAEGEREWNATFARMRGGAQVVIVSGARHMSFSDYPYLAPDKHSNIRIDPARGLEITNAYVLAFFEKTLKGRRQPLLEGPSPYREVTLELYQPGAKTSVLRPAGGS